MTPKAMARIAATTMSTVRQRLLVMGGSSRFGYQEKTHATPGIGHGAAGGPELPALALPRSGSRVSGRRPAPDLGRRCPSAGGRTSKISGAGAALSALCAPLSDVYLCDPS